MRARESREWRAEDTGSSSDKTVHQGWLSDVLGHSSTTVEAKTYRQSDYAPLARGSLIIGFSMYLALKKSSRT